LVRPPVYDAKVPYFVKIRILAEECHSNAVSALITAPLGAMERLMDVSNQMNEEHQSFGALFFVLGPVSERFSETLNSIYYAISF